MRIKGFGRIRDLADWRDYGVGHPRLPEGFSKTMLAPLQAVGIEAASIEVDMEDHVARIMDQGDLGACTGHGTIGVHEFLDKKLYGRFTPLSRLFLYKVTRDFIGVRGDTGAEIRNAMGALAFFGAPPEEYYTYDVHKFDLEPAPFHYALAQSYKGTQYARLDLTGMTGPEILEACKGSLLKGWPFVFGFTCYESLDDCADGNIPWPTERERVTGGHCVYAMGFADHYDKCPRATPGAFKIANSWGTSAGDRGFYYMPYDYFLRGQAQDCWILTKADWIDVEPFK